MVAYCSCPAVLKLTLGSTTLDLMDQNNGFRVGQLDLGYPDIREDIDPMADRNGMLDYTRLFGARPVTIAGSVVPSAAGSRQKALQALAPFLDPSARPVLTYQVDPDVGPRTMTLRAAQFANVFDNPTLSAFQVGFKAADPLVYDANVQVAYVDLGGAAGRAYNLTFNRTYPAGGGTQAYTANNGTFPAYPLLRIYGPVTGPYLVAVPLSGGTSMGLNFISTFVINAGNYVQVDCRARTALLNGDPGNSVYGQLTYMPQQMWPVIGAGQTLLWTMGGTNYSTSSQTQISWQNAYLL